MNSAPVTLHNAAFPTYKAARVHHAARRRGGGVAAPGTCAAGRRCRWVGILTRSPVALNAANVAAFRDGLQRRSAMSRARTSRSNTAGPTASSTACRSWSTELVQRQVPTSLVTRGTPATLAAKNATPTHPDRLRGGRRSGRDRPGRRAWRGPAATSPGTWRSLPSWRRSGWSCCSELVPRSSSCRLHRQSEQCQRAGPQWDETKLAAQALGLELRSCSTPAQPEDIDAVVRRCDAQRRRRACRSATTRF